MHDSMTEILVRRENACLTPEQRSKPPLPTLPTSAHPFIVGSVCSLQYYNTRLQAETSSVRGQHADNTTHALIGSVVFRESETVDTHARVRLSSQPPRSPRVCVCVCLAPGGGKIRVPHQTRCTTDPRHFFLLAFFFFLFF